MPIAFPIGSESTMKTRASNNSFAQRSVYGLDRTFATSRADSVARAAGSCHCGSRALVQVSAGTGNCVNSYV